MNYSDRELLAKTLQAEAGNQGIGGLLDVGSVIMNRVGQSGGSLRDVILKPAQFSAWNSVTGYAGGEQGQDMANMKPDARAYMVADNLLSGDYTDATGGATHYYNPSISNPDWGMKSGGNWAKRGDHVFGRADDQPKMNIATGGQPMMQPEQKPKGLLGGLFSDPDRRARLAMGLEGMTLNPNQAFMSSLQGGIDKRAASTEVEQKTSKTIEALSRMNTPQAKAALEYLSAGGDPVSALKMAFGKDKAQAGVVVDNKLINPVTGDVIYQGEEQQNGLLTKDKLAGLNSLRDDLRSELKPFEIVKSGYNNITTFYNNPSATSDYALAVAFAKILDPGSVAREGEVAAVQNAGARIPALGQALKNAVTGEGQLTQEVRQQIAELATKVYSERQGEAKGTISHYEEMAARAGLPAEFIYSGSIPDARSVVPAVVPANAVAQGITQSMWDDSTDEEKKAWLE